MTETQVNDPDLRLTVIDKYDRRTKTTHPSVETEALSQQVIVDIVRRKLDQLLPEPLEDIAAREEAERERLRRVSLPAICGVCPGSAKRSGPEARRSPRTPIMGFGPLGASEIETAVQPATTPSSWCLKREEGGRHER